MTEINIHTRYSTISHEHLDDLVSWVTGEYPDSGLVLAECSDGLWFIEVDYGHAFDSFLGVSKPKCIPYLEPNFYSSRKEALTTALQLIKQVYKNLNEEKILEYLKREDAASL